MSQLGEFLRLGFTVLAFLLLIKLASSYLPEQGIWGALKSVIKGA